jgi:hypothetical protein
MRAEDLLHLEKQRTMTVLAILSFVFLGFVLGLFTMASLLFWLYGDQIADADNGEKYWLERHTSRGE